MRRNGKKWCELHVTKSLCQCNRTESGVFLIVHYNTYRGYFILYIFILLYLYYIYILYIRIATILY